MADSQTQATAIDLAPAGIAARITRTESLLKRPRPIEGIARRVMLVCGLISILTTVGIVLVLGGEALYFFTTREYIDTNKNLTASVTAEQTTLPVSRSGINIPPGSIIKLGDELMRVVSVVEEESYYIVERGLENTTPTEHPNQRAISIGVDVNPIEFFTNTVWQPQAGLFGVLPLLSATIMASFIGLLVAVPLGLGSAIYLSEYARPNVRAIIKPILELLAG
ncbi:MAG: hypothetical protein NZM00_12730, partial [Anaerolinea sp.]|nr:hypothetical protein [Anaerolinea sp.]